ncbi:MAG: GIY-YIG nuclease family protein [Chloroflexi bacterium]|nr:GIY-YIG nuclease family protein [Chloroflexota bacterium]
MKGCLGSYLLVACLNRKSQIQIGKLGVADFPSGFYVFCGSALGGLGSRVGRHFREDKRLHWHIDYLLVAAKVVEAWHCQSKERLECCLSDMPRRQVLRVSFATNLPRNRLSDMTTAVFAWVAAVSSADMIGDWSQRSESNRRPAVYESLMDWVDMG